MGLGMGLAFWSGAASFTPKSIPGLTAWFDASQITGVANGASLATWPDESGNGYNATQATAAYQPNYYSSTSGKTVNGLPAVWFESAPDGMATTSFASLLTIGTVFSVASIGNSTGYVYDGTSSGERWAVGAGLLATDEISSFAGVGIGYSDSIYPTPISQWTATYTNGASTGVLRLNGTTQATGNPGPYSLGGLTIGNRYSFSNGISIAPVCEIIVYDSILSSADISKVESYLKSKWGTP